MTAECLFITRLLFNKGDVIFEEHEDRDFAYIIERGSVDIERSEKKDSSEVPLNVGAGEIFGESAILEPGKRTATATAAEDLRLYALSPNILKQRMADLDPLVKLLISMLIDKYRDNRLQKAGVIEVNDQDDGLSVQQELLLASYDDQKETVLLELQMEQELRRALDDREFMPYLQPIVEFASGRIMGYETLVRWHHPAKGIIYPNDFIPIAERTNVVQLIDQRMLEAACDLVPKLHEIAGKDAENMFISVNLSGVNFNDDSVVDRVEGVLAQHSFNPKQLKLEITESALVHDSEQAAAILGKLKATGATIALDDFGTGYSSLGYLHKFSIDSLKIDRSFVQQLHKSKKSLDIVKAVVGLAHTFDLSIIAEGIEEQTEVDILKNLNCSYGQGYYFGRPIEASEALKLFAKQYSTGALKAENMLKCKRTSDAYS